MPQVVIDRRFNGPPDSGNGGYVCGLIANAIEGPAVCTLRKPPPLDRELILQTPEQGKVVLWDGDVVIGEAVPEPLSLALPEPPSFDEAVEASRHYAGFQAHLFPTCFVCGPGRPLDDGMQLYPGAIPERSIVATPWTPNASMPHESHRIRDEILWAALDCTSYFPHYPAKAVLGRLHGELLREARVGERYMVVGWKIGGEGRKRWSGSAVFDEDGNACASAKATWIELKPDQSGFRVEAGG
ncbi:MAG: hypothetical protein AMJ62_14795 [Myxococcales bacterium SG8_38]|nr:MAG: hypothetical protein AMJ62_14795 [Myxococcales bacterium SG8_38]